MDCQRVLIGHRCRASMIVACALFGCAPDSLAQAELDEICGQPAPVQLLETEPDEALAQAGQMSRAGDRRILYVTYQDDTEDALGFPPYGRREYWSVGECGESPLLLAVDDWRLTAFDDAWPDQLFACDEETGEVMVIDPIGARDPHLVFDLPDCSGHSRTPWGLVAIEPHDEYTGAVMLWPWPDDPWTEAAAAQALLDPVRIRAEPPHTWPEEHEVLDVSEDELFAITPANELVHLSLIDGTLTVEATNVREFERSQDSRWLAWQDLAVTGDDPEWPEGPIWVRDRTTGTNTHVADTALAFTSGGVFAVIDDGVIRLKLGGIFSDVERLFVLPSFETFDLQPPDTVMCRLDDGRWLVGGDWAGPYWLFDPATLEREVLFDREGNLGYLPYRDDELTVLEGVSCCVSDDFGRNQGRLWRVPLDGTEPEVIGRRVSYPYAFLPDWRVLTLLEVGQDWLGKLAVIDDETLEEQVVDDHVLSGVRAVEDDGSIVYAVDDDARAGVWLTRVAE